MMRYSRALALVLALSFAFSSEGFRLRRMGGHNVAADSHPDIDEPSRETGTDGFVSSSEEDKAGEEEQDMQVADGSISPVEEEEAREEEPDERDAEDSFPEDGEQVDEVEPGQQDAEQSSFIGDDVDDEEYGDDEDHNEQDNAEPSFVQEDVDEGDNMKDPEPSFEEEHGEEDGEQGDDEEHDEQDTDESSFMQEDEAVMTESHAEQFTLAGSQQAHSHSQHKRCKGLNDKCSGGVGRGNNDCCSRRYCAGWGNVRWCSNVGNDGRP